MGRLSFVGLLLTTFLYFADIWTGKKTLRAALSAGMYLFQASFWGWPPSDWASAEGGRAAPQIPTGLSGGQLGADCRLRTAHLQLLVFSTFLYFADFWAGKKT